MQEHIESSYAHDASKGKVFHTRQLACPTFSSHKASTTCPSTTTSLKAYSPERRAICLSQMCDMTELRLAQLLQI